MSQIDHLIINSPYKVPISYWHYDREKRKFILEKGRRSAGYLVASEHSKSFDDPGEFHELPLVNQIRNRVDSWRKNNYSGITGITRRLLEFWNDPKERENRFFFCQLEAIETIIWLTEGPENEKQGIVIQSDGGPFERICSKMATGSGKTIVMGMLIAWQVLNKITYPTDTRFSKNVLVIAPGLTVKNRLEVLQPSSENSIYNQFRIVPDSFYDKLRHGRVKIYNWHVLMPIEENKRSVVKKGKESNEAFTRRILGEMSQSKNIIVINDEAHHAWRIKPGVEVDIEKEELEEATKWMEGLDKIHSARNILKCFDFSATPFIPSGKNVSEEFLFEWIVSDFSLNDAIESGLVKTPRIAIRDDSGKYDKNYRSRFYHIYKDLDVKSDINRRAKPEEPLPDLIKNAYYLLGQDWLVTRREWEKHKSPIPPVMITVCNRTETSARIKYSFERNKFDLEGLSDPKKILHIDSKVLKEAESKESVETEETELVLEPDEKLTIEKKAELLRETVDTVGKIGKPGEQIQNIIAVSMLSEGWDARTVTQIMGLRAFTSQLLCEQVVGRGLRRTSYEVNPETGFFEPEYVNIFGVPFTFLPHEGSSDTPPPPTTPQTRIEPDPEKIEHKISWPNIDRIERTYSPKLSLDWNKVKPLQLRPDEVSLTVDMAQVIDGKPAIDKMSDIDLEKLGKKVRMQWLIFRVARDVYESLKPEWKGNDEFLLLQLVNLVEGFIRSGKIEVLNVLEGEELRKRLTIAFNMNKVVQHIFQVIKFENTEKRALVFNKEKPIKSTSDMQPWYSKKHNEYTVKSHISHAIQDSSWEANATFELERNQEVISWVKNDHLGFEIQYIYNGVVHKYYPDYLICLKNGITIVLEIKGQDSQQEQTKREALDEWIKAVNQDGRFGTWAWDVAFIPSEVRPKIAKYAKADVSSEINVKCPACGMIANNRQQVENLFGFRNMDGIIRPQSWCRDCRKIKNLL